MIIGFDGQRSCKKQTPQHYINGSIKAGIRVYEIFFRSNGVLQHYGPQGRKGKGKAIDVS
jgi:hypothetical protein